MSLIGVIPADMFSPERLDDVIMQLRMLDVPPRRKKELFTEWGQAVGAALTKEDYQKLLGIESKKV